MSSFVIDDYRLDITPQGNYPVVYLSQFEDGRDIRFYMLNRGRSFTIPTGISAFVSGLKSNGGYYEHACTIDDNYVIMPVEADMTDVSGRGVANIRFTNQSGDKVISAKFIVNVQESVSDSGIEVPTEAETVFQQLLDEIRQQAASISLNVTELNNNVEQFKSDINTEVNTFESGVDSDIAVLTARMDTFIAQHSGVSANATKITEDVLWEGNLYNSNEGTEFDIDGFNLSSYNYIDVYFTVAGRQVVGRVTPNAFTSSNHVQFNFTNLQDDVAERITPLANYEFNIECNLLFDDPYSYHCILNIIVWTWSGESTASSYQRFNQSTSHSLRKIVGVKYENIEASKDTELTDIRVGADGVTYATAGAAIRTQLSNIMDRLSRLEG